MCLVKGETANSASGEKIGALSRVVINPKTREVTHFVINEWLLFKERKLIPVLWISTIGEQQVNLSVNSKPLERVPAFEKGC